MENEFQPGSMNQLQRMLLQAAGLIALALMGAILAHFSMATHPRFLTLSSAVDSQTAILDRRIFVFEGVAVDYPSWRNRVIVPLLMRAITLTTPASPSQAYLVVRWMTACSALAAFAWLVRSVARAGYWLCGFAAGLLALSLFPTFLHIYEVPSDFLDAAFFSLLLLFILEDRRIAFAVVLMVALLNREFAVFSVVAWWAVHAWPFGRRGFLLESAYCLCLGVAGSALVAWVRVKNAVLEAPLSRALQPLDGLRNFRVHAAKLHAFVLHPVYGSPYFFLFGYIVFISLIMAALWRELPRELRRLGWVALCMYGVSLAYGDIDELRINIPGLVICSLLLVYLATKESPRGQS